MNRTSPSSRLVRTDGQVAGPLERRPGRDPQAHAHLGGHDAGQAWSCPGPGARRTGGGRPARPAGGPPPGGSRGAGGARAGRRTRPAGGAAASTSSASSAGDAPGAEQLVHARSPAVPCATGRGARSTARSLRASCSSTSTGPSAGRARARRGPRRRRSRGPRGRPAPRPGRLGPPPAADAGRGRSGRAWRPARAGAAGRALAPTPGTRVRASRSPSVTTRRSAAGRVDREDGQGQRGPDAVGADQRLEAVALVAVAKPNRVRASSRTWRWVWRTTGPPGLEGGHRLPVGRRPGSRRRPPRAAPRRRAPGRGPCPAATRSSSASSAVAAAIARARPAPARAGRTPAAALLPAPPRGRGPERPAARWQRARARASAASGGLGSSARPRSGLHHALHLLLGRRRRSRRPPA